MSKKFKCTVVETYTQYIEIPDEVDIADVDLSDETVTPIRNDSIVDLVYKDGDFEESKYE